MTTSDITENVSGLGTTWEQFKQINDARLNELERKGYADPLYDEHLHNINMAMDSYKQRLDRIETAGNRPMLGGEVESVKSNGKDSPYGKAFRN